MSKVMLSQKLIAIDIAMANCNGGEVNILNNCFATVAIAICYQIPVPTSWGDKDFGMQLTYRCGYDDA